MRYMIAYSSDTVHYSAITYKQTFDTGLPNKQSFTNYDAWVDRLSELGVDTSDIEKSDAVDEQFAFDENAELELRVKVKELEAIIEKLKAEKTLDSLDEKPKPKKWKEGQNLERGDKIEHDSITYLVLQDHSTQKDWQPADVPALYQPKREETDGQPPQWEQPDSTNPYMKGDQITFEGEVWESTIDDNVWSPTGYPQGWKQI